MKMKSSLFLALAVAARRLLQAMRGSRTLVVPAAAARPLPTQTCRGAFCGVDGTHPAARAMAEAGASSCVLAVTDLIAALV